LDDGQKSVSAVSADRLLYMYNPGPSDNQLNTDNSDERMTTCMCVYRWSGSSSR